MVQQSIRRLAALLTICLLAAGNLLAQTENTSPQNQELSLPKLSGKVQAYHYSEDARERAEVVASLVESASRYFLTQLSFLPHVDVYILSPKDWKSVALKPLWEVYGFPHTINHTRLVVASEDNPFWQSTLPAMDQLSEAQRNMVKQAYGRSDGSMDMGLFFDLLAIHEMGHSYSSQGGLKMQRHWMNELFANLLLHTLVAERHPERLAALEAYPQLVLSRDSGKMKYTSLADFEKLYSNLGMGPENYVWYQCRLHQAAKEIYDAGGKQALIRLWAALEKHQEDLTDEQLVQMLDREVGSHIASVFTDWDKK
ncbi:MAG TPA: hypothetical protein VIK80_09225 [Flavihumibacter sp.]